MDYSTTYYQPYSYQQAQQALQGAYGQAYGQLATQYQQMQQAGMAQLNQSGLGNTSVGASMQSGYFNAYQQARNALLGQQQQQNVQTGMGFNQLGVQQQQLGQGWQQLANQQQGMNNQQAAQQWAQQQTQAQNAQQGNQQVWNPGSYVDQGVANNMIGAMDMSQFGSGNTSQFS